MKIENMVIENFKSIESAELNPKKMTVLIGPNGVGKSSTLEAVRYLLTGKAPTLPVRDGATTMRVAADLFGSHIERSAGKKNAVRMDGKVTTQSSIVSFLEAATGINSQTMQVATSAEILASMASGDLATFLTTSGLIPAELDLATILSLCSMSSEAAAELEKVVPPSGVFTLDDIADVHDQFYAARKAAKAEFSKRKPYTLFEGTPPLRTIAQVEKDEIEFHSYDAKVEAYKSFLEAHQRDQQRIADFSKQIASLEASLKGKRVDPVDPNEFEHLTKTEAQLRKKIAELSATVDAFDKNINMYQRSLSTLDQPVCPLSAKLICTTDKTAIREELTALLELNAEERRKACDQRNVVEGNLASVLTRIESYRKREKEYQNYVATAKQRDALRSAMPKPTPPPIPPSIIPNAAERKRELDDERKAILRYNESIKAQKDCEQLVREIEVYDELVTILSPKSGIREKVIAAATEALIEHCNSRSAILNPNFTISMKVDNGVHIMCSPDSTKTGSLPLEAVSSGEQVYVMLLILDALNILSGLGVLLLDDLDKLDESALVALFELLSNHDVTDPYDHIILAMVNHEDSVRVVDRYKSIIDDLIFMS